MKAGWTKIVLTLWLSGWTLSMYYEVSTMASVGFLGILGLTAMLAYQSGRGDDAWK